MYNKHSSYHAHSAYIHNMTKLLNVKSAQGGKFSLKIMEDAAADRWLHTQINKMLTGLDGGTSNLEFSRTAALSRDAFQ